jgi:hypothetical protein
MEVCSYRFTIIDLEEEQSMKHTGLSITNERGAAGIKAVVAIAILVAVIYAGFQLIPVYWAHWNFEDKVKQKVLYAFNNYTDVEKELYNEITRMLDRMGVTYDKKNVRVKIDKQTKKIQVEVWYSRTVNLPFFPNPKQFYVKVANVPLE